MVDAPENGSPRTPARIFVLGSLNADFTVRLQAIPKAGETLLGESLMFSLGGKGANQAVAAARMGGRVSMAGKVGQDVFGDRLCEALRQEGIDMRLIRTDPDVSTGAAFIMLEPSGQNRIIVVPGANSTYTIDELHSAVTSLQEADLLLLQLEIDFQVVQAAVCSARELGVPVLLNPGPAPKKPFSEDLLKMLDCITPNEVEAEALTGVRVENPQDAERAAKMLCSRGVEKVVITLGEQGAVVAERGNSALVPPCKVEAVDTVAAGDAFTGALAVSLCEGADLFEASRFAAVAAAITVTRNGAMASIPRRAEVEQFRQT